jgi:geranyl-CoA carboxylase alpha subunit
VSLRCLLVANRGEIACRILRTARHLGFRTVAVFSDADAQAPHVRLADAALRIGPAPAAQSYLDIQALLKAAQLGQADAVHPGYGFLSERADFAQACTDAGLVFVGPPAAAIRAMGDKIGAKRRMLAAGVPCVPGFHEDDASDERLIAQAQALGVPLLVKAAAGGGGRGIRRVDGLAELPAALLSARREAQAAFGDGRLLLERLVEDARHIEVQVFADAHGEVVHLGERDCTAQRRRQKVLEEAPSPAIDEALRERLCTSAIAAAKAVGYCGAGTVEFVVDRQGRHHFLEMNTRLQVEHPVTECLTGIDLVEWQLRVADGEPLPLRQHEVRMQGHAIEARLVVEDPYDGWKPQAGPVLGWRPEDAGLRVDHGLRAGDRITPHYDAMVAKFVAHGRTRADATRRLARALEDAVLFGPPTNGRFLRDLLRHPAFASGDLTTTRIDEWAACGEAILQRPDPPDWAWRVAAAAWAGPDARRPPGLDAYDLVLCCQQASRTQRMPLPDTTVVAWDDGWLSCRDGPLTRRLPALKTPDAVHLAIDGACFVFSEPSPHPRRATATDPARACSPLAGAVAQVLVAPGDAVRTGQPLASVEAMKMETWVHAGADGRVLAVHAQPGAAVAAGTLLVELEVLQP